MIAQGLQHPAMVMGGGLAGIAIAPPILSQPRLPIKLGCGEWLVPPQAQASA